MYFIIMSTYKMQRESQGFITVFCKLLSEQLVFSLVCVLY